MNKYFVRALSVPTLEHTENKSSRITTPEWVEGFLSKSRPSFKDGGGALRPCIDFEEKGVMCSSFIVPETIERCTGETDSHGVTVYEGNLLRIDTAAHFGIVRFGAYKTPDAENIGFYVEWIAGPGHEGLRKDLGYWLKYSHVVADIHSSTPNELMMLIPVSSLGLKAPATLEMKEFLKKHFNLSQGG